MSKNKTKTSEGNNTSEVSKEETLKANEEALAKREQEVVTKEEALAKREQELATKEEALAKREQEVATKEEGLAKGTTKKTPKPQKGLDFTFRNEKYKFSDDAPVKIRFGGKVCTQKQLTEDEDALVELLGGNSSLIQKL